MGARTCDICKGKDGYMAPTLPSLLDRHLGILVCREVSSCNDCSQILQMWDNFSKQAKSVLKDTHPNANFNSKQGSPLGQKNNRKRQKTAEQIIVLNLDEDSDNSDVMICEDNTSDNNSEIPSHKDIPKDTCLKKKLTIPLNSQINHTEENIPDDVDKSPIRFVCPPAVWDLPLEEQERSEPDRDPLALIPLIVKQEPCTIPNPSVHENEEIFNMESNLQTEVMSYNEVIDPLHQKDIKPTIPTCPDLDNKLSKFQCHLCNKKYSLQHVLNVHIRSKHKKQSATDKNGKNLQYKCPTCEKLVTSEEVLEKHILKYHTSNVQTTNSEGIKLESIHLCEKCCKSFKSEEILKAHMEKVHTNINLLHKNTECNNIIESDHAQCPFCSQYYSTLKNLERHISLYHPDPTSITMAFVAKKNNNVVCDFCKKNLCSKEMLQFHVLNVHADIISGKTQKCMKINTNPAKICNDSLLSEESLQKNYSKIHLLSNASTSSVNYPETKSSNHNTENNSISLNHEDGCKKETKTAVKYFRCKKCEFVTYKRDEFKNHKLEKHPVRYTRSSLANIVKFTCSPCSKSFPSKDTLNHHNRLYHTTKPQTSPKPECSNMKQNKKPVCHICGKVFGTKIRLSAHLESHSDKNTEIQKPQNENCDKTKVDELSINDKIKTSSKQLSKYALYESKFKKRDGAYFCNYCLKPSETLNKIIYHIRRLHLSNEDIEKLKSKIVEPHKTCKHSCGKCLETFESQHDLSVHTKTHSIKTNLHKTETERTLEISSSSTTEEVLRVLILKGNFSCNFCKQTLKSMDEIYNHCQKNHEPKLKTVNKKFVIDCNVCSVSISSMEILGTHIETKHKKHTLNTTQGTGKHKHWNQDKISETLDSDNKNSSIPLQVNKISSELNSVSVIRSTKVPSVKEFYCYICDKLLHVKDAMEYHMKQSHMQYLKGS